MTNPVTPTPVIEARGLTKRYGGLVAVDALDLTFHKGAISGVIGPNGAGKSTLIGLLGGALRPTSGSVCFMGRDISRAPAAERARLGIGRTYQLPRPFLDMTTRENLQVALFSKAPLMPRRDVAARTDFVLEQTGLADVGHRSARDLPLLRRKRLEVARALMLDPALLLLDEVGAGLVDHEINDLIRLIQGLNDGVRSIIIIEHVIRLVRDCCTQLTVLNFGKKLAEGTTADILADDKVAAVYLGTAHSPGKAQRSFATAQVLAPRTLDKAATPLLRLTDVDAGYGQARVLNEVSFDVAQGEVVAVLGSNGAGKTTLANVIAGGLASKGGTIRLAGEDVTQLRGDKRFARGVAHCMEGRRIFPELTVEENLKIALRGAARADTQGRLDEIYALFPILAERRRSGGTRLSGGQLQMLAIGRALISKPRLVIFDEISLGLAPVVMDQLYGSLATFRDSGLSMLVIEQDVERALELADTAHVLLQGKIVLSGAARALAADPRLRDLYLGEEHTDSRLNA
ncbi:ATP-binding cassette domain-containing protein [Agrobacterium vitis]|uniref:ATP-binding cassette domain-containing protein n=1 Tax=Agrobacterium vitis TaxID=373 RepID=A0A6L6VLW8_AGRVI|nr:ATP-binding cassette domain-containing protein [Agrobacterium vitis]MUZ76031.1 ATP-binding cassette domain-containing protein [Agrobacterium vitis]